MLNVSYLLKKVPLAITIIEQSITNSLLLCNRKIIIYFYLYFPRKAVSALKVPYDPSISLFYTYDGKKFYGKKIWNCLILMVFFRKSY